MMKSEVIEVPDLVPARMLNEYVYCPRLAYLEWVQGDFTESDDTLKGQWQHRNVDKEKGVVPDEPSPEMPDFKATSVLLSSEKYGLIAKIDLIEGEGGKVTPVDYKKGKKPDLPAGAWDPERVQVCAHGLILEDNGYVCTEGIIYYVETKDRVTIPFDEQLKNLTLDQLSKMRKMASVEEIPPPLEDSPKCPRCSLVGICLPDETNALRGSNETSDDEDIRRLIPLEKDALPVYVQQQGASVGKQGEELTVKAEGKIIAKTRLLEVSQVCLFGNVQLSAQLIKVLCDRGIPVCHFSFGNWFYGITHGMSHKNVELRRLQYRLADDEGRAVQIARRMIGGKIRNCRTLLKRNNEAVPQPALDELERMNKLALDSGSWENLLGIEGSASRIYFLHFGGMLKVVDDKGISCFDLDGRNRRPPRDPVNSLLSFLYAILTKDVTVTLLSIGLDPYLGVFHRPRYGRPALALDLMEEFRPIIADSVVVSAINNGEVKIEDFIRKGAGTALVPDGRKKILAAYERRMDTLVTHPIFNYKISYSRLIEVQARLLARSITGEIGSYPPFCTR